MTAATSRSAPPAFIALVLLAAQPRSDIKATPSEFDTSQLRCYRARQGISIVPVSTTRHSGHQHPRPNSAAVVDDILARLSSLGYRDTEPRRLVISAVAAQGRPFTAEELCTALPCVGRATVYRSLRLLVETGQVCRVLLEDHELRYQLSQPGHHHHLLCGVCGASAHLERCDAEDLLREAAAAAGFRMSGHWLEVYGECGECVGD